MAIRRRLMAAARPSAVDTSPKVAEYGKACAFATTGERSDPNLCITEWYQFYPSQVGVLTLYYKLGQGRMVRSDGNYQYYAMRASDSDIKRDWYYPISTSNYNRSIGWGLGNYTLQEIRFTVVTADIDDVYAYCIETGQIFFAGKNTPYYSTINGYPIKRDSWDYERTEANPNGNPELALIVAQADYADAIKDLSIAHNRAGWAVTLERWDGVQLARKSFGAFPDMTPPEPQPEPELEEPEEPQESEAE